MIQKQNKIKKFNLKINVKKRFSEFAENLGKAQLGNFKKYGFFKLKNNHY